MTWPYVDMAELETRVRRRSDLSTSSTNPQFVAQAELQQYIQKSWEKLYNYLVGKYEDYFVKVAGDTAIFEYTVGTSGLVAGKEFYSFPSDYFKLIRIDLFTGAGGSRTATTLGEYKWTLKKLGFMQERGFHSSVNTGTPQAYVLFGRVDAGTIISDKAKANGFKLVPTPDRTYALDIYYVPRPPVIPTADEESDGLSFVAGWDEYVVLDACIKVHDKRREDTSVLMAERNDWLAAVENALTPRDAGQPFEAFASSIGGYGSDEDLEELVTY